MRATRTGLVVAALAAVALLAGCTSDGDYADLQTSLPGGGPTTTVAPDGPTPPCDGDPGVGGVAPDGSAPGDLVAATRLDETHGDSAGYPTDASVWRILYVSIGVDESDLELVCGVAAAPSKGPSSEGGTGHLVSWAHGTIGLQQACLPSNIPATTFWGPMGSGIGAIGWGTGFGKHLGKSADGALQTALDRGWVVSATDYQPNDTYIMGRVAGANVVDAARATTQLMEREFGEASNQPTGAALPTDYDTISWGHSQGGHAAMWAGQIFESYLAGTPNPRSAGLTLRGVALEAPAVNLIAQPDKQAGVEYGDGLADWEMHKSIEIIGLPIPALELQIGPALFSYIFGSWSEYSQRGTPAADAEFPAFPADAADLDLSTVATVKGATTIAQISPLCLAGSDAKIVKKLVAPYRDAESHRMLTPELWNLPDQYRAGDFFHGGTDEACGTTTDPKLVAWCDWIRWNTPGPLGDNPFPKVPTTDGKPVPVLIAQGADDEVIHCSPPKGSNTSTPPDASNCMGTALFDNLRDSAYCPATGDVGSLRLSIFRQDGSGSPASHLSIPGQIAARGSSKSAEDLSFEGSPLDDFFTSSFDGTTKPGCEAKVLNPT